MDKEARVPEDTPLWEAIDIFVFSNGQQNSPPRKYHLRIDDLSWWRATLKYLGKQQYGSTTSYIDLYTLEGRKVKGPLELSHGTFYVAVEPLKDFVDAGYEKYLIKASRSWEKRQAQRINNDMPSDDPGIVSRELNKTGEQKIKTQEGSVILNTIISSVVENESSIIVSPRPVPNSEQKPKTQNNVTTVKTVEKKRISIQRPAFIKKISPNLPNQPLVSNIKPPFKRSGFKSPNIVTISKPENDGGIKATKLPIRTKLYKPTNSPKVPPIPEVVVSNVHQVVDEMKTSSSIKISDNNNQNILTEAAEISNTVKEKEVVAVSNIYKNPQNETASINVDSLGPLIVNTQPLSAPPLNPELANNEPKLDLRPDLHIKNNPTKSNDNTKPSYQDPAEQREKKMADMKIRDIPKRLSILKSEYGNSRPSENSNHNLIPKESPPISKVMAETNNNIIMKDFSSSKVTIFPNKNENSVKNVDTKLQSNSISPNIHSNNQPKLNDLNELIENKNNDVSQDLISPGVSKLTKEEKIYNLQPKENPFNEVTEVLHKITNYDNFKLNSEENPTINHPNLLNEVNSKEERRYQDANDSERILSTNIKVHRVSSVVSSNVTQQFTHVPDTNKAIETDNINDVQMGSLKNNDKNTLGDSRNLNDEYMATLNKGDTIHLKLNIEIKKDENSTNNNTVKSDTSPKEKASQIIFLCNNIVKHRSLLSLILKEVEKHIEEKNNVIIVQCNGCKYCKEPGTNIDAILNNKNEILPPTLRECSGDKVTYSNCEDERCSIVNPVKAVASCMSIERLKKVSVVSFPIAMNHNRNTSPHHIHNLNESLTDKEVVKKKSVIISDACQFCGGTDYNVIPNKESEECGKRMNNADCFTQTDWCNILLEVKLENDGHYTFCLPSLGTLKYFKLV